MEFKSVRVVDGNEKSAVEIEKELVEQHEKSLEENQGKPVEEEKVIETTLEPIVPELREEDVLSFIKSKRNIEVNSLDEFEALLQNKPADLPEDVATYLKFKQDTGRSFEDFVKLQKDYSKEDPMKTLKDFYIEQDPEISDRELSFKLRKFTYDVDMDDEDEVTEKQLHLKEELSKAKDHFNNLKEQYKVPLESRDSFVPESEKENYKAFKRNLEQAQTVEQENQVRSKFFAEQTNKLFSDGFEGFKFKNGESELVYKPAEAKTLKESQSDISNFIGKFLDDKGFLKDSEAFHRAIAVASDPDKFFSFAYEQGKADGVNGLEKDSKNIDMGTKSATTITPKAGLIIRDASAGEQPRYKLK